MINIAVLITCHNRKHKTVKCLQKLYSQNNIENIKLKVFLVDDGSSDGTGQTVKKLFPDITIIKGSGNLFWGGGMFLAWETALKDNIEYNYFLWINDDTFLFEDAISTLLGSKKMMMILSLEVYVIQLQKKEHMVVRLMKKKNLDLLNIKLSMLMDILRK